MLFKLLRGLIDVVEGATRLLFAGARRLVDSLERRSGGATRSSEPGDGP